MNTSVNCRLRPDYMTFKDKLKKKSSKLNNSVRKAKQHNPNRYNFFGENNKINNYEIESILNSYEESRQNY